MNHTHTVRCSDCGSLALRSYLTSEIKGINSCSGSKIIKTECPSCDYLLITCSENGKVIDAHTSAGSVIARNPNIKNCPPAISMKTKSAMSWSAKISA